MPKTLATRLGVDVSDTVHELARVSIGPARDAVLGGYDRSGREHRAAEILVVADRPLQADGGEEKSNIVSSWRLVCPRTESTRYPPKP